jgi:hypothetical protein
MTNDQEQLRQHWQQLAEQLGLEPSEPAAPLSMTSMQEAKEPFGSSSESSTVEYRETKVKDQEFGFEHSGSPIEDRKSQLEDEVVKQVESISESQPSTPASSPSEDYSPSEEPTREERRGGHRGRKPRGSDRGERSPRAKRDSGRRRQEAEPTPAEDRTEGFAVEESREDSESSEEVEPAILHDSSSPELESAEEDIDDVDTLSDWNVPSWSELIGSLYRPDR